MIAPHFRLVQFLSSHFNATRLGSRQIQRVYYRLMHVTLDAMGHTMEHPLARETHFHIVLLGLRILQFGTDMDMAAQWRLKDRILSAALAWFSIAPRCATSLTSFSIELLTLAGGHLVETAFKSKRRHTCLMTFKML